MSDHFEYKNWYLSIACEEEKYGADCKEICGHCRDVKQCSYNNGTCLTGCDAGFKGNLCKTGKCNEHKHILISFVMFI